MELLVGIWTINYYVNDNILYDLYFDDTKWNVAMSLSRFIAMPSLCHVTQLVSMFSSSFKSFFEVCPNFFAKKVGIEFFKMGS